MLLTNLTEKENLTGVSLWIDKKGYVGFNGFKLLNVFTKSPILDVWRVQNLHLTLINSKNF